MSLPIKLEGIIFSNIRNRYKFLLIKRVPADGGFWQPLTETLEDGETLQECLLRGLKEELGIEKVINITGQIWSFAWENKRGEPNIDLVFGVEISPKATVRLNLAEHSDYKWCTFTQSLILLGKENNRLAFHKFQENILAG